MAYRRILVPLADAKKSERAIEIACRLAGEHGVSLTALTVIEVPVTVPMDAHMIEEETEAKRVLDLARAIAHGYGVSVSARVVRARDAGEARSSETRRRTHLDQHSIVPPEKLAHHKRSWQRLARELMHLDNRRERSERERRTLQTNLLYRRPGDYLTVRPASTSGPRSRPSGREAAKRYRLTLKKYRPCR